MSERAYLVVDLGFGDAGKGTVTDALVQTRGAGLVLRFNGGAQAGHNVVLDDGRHHTFAQLGAGSFVPGTRTWLASTVRVHPLALELECRAFERVAGFDPRPSVSIDREAIVTTPFHQALGRLRELARGDARHGSCGVGVGETVAHALAHPGGALTVARLAEDPRAARRCLLDMREALHEAHRALLPSLPDVPAVRDERAVFEATEWIARYVDACRVVLGRVEVADHARLGALVASNRTIVAEGAQGVLLDEWHGMHPHTTYGTCTFEHALGALRAHGFVGEIVRVGVTRSYAVRHGQGPLPTASPAYDVLLEPHNVDGPWQGRVRKGPLDLPLLRYAVDCCGGIDALAITHLDAPRRLGAHVVAIGYEASEPCDPDVFATHDAPSARPCSLRVSHARDLALAERRTKALEAVRPTFARWPADAPGEERFVAEVEAVARARTLLRSHGPRRGDKRWSDRLA